MKKLFKKNGLELCEIGIKKSKKGINSYISTTTIWQTFLETNALIEAKSRVEICTYRSLSLFGLELYIELKIYKNKKKCYNNATRKN